MKQYFLLCQSHPNTGTWTFLGKFDTVEALEKEVSHRVELAEQSEYKWKMITGNEVSVAVDIKKSIDIKFVEA